MTKQILINEDGRNNFDSKIKKEINLLKQEKNFLLIDYLTIMILGLTGVGKSTMVKFFIKIKKARCHRSKLLGHTNNGSKYI